MKMEVFLGEISFIPKNIGFKWKRVVFAIFWMPVVIAVHWLSKVPF